MNKKTVQKLQALTTDFYLYHATAFSQTRQRAWPGWERYIQLLETIVPMENLNILDLGCGNGRFLSFLTQNIPNQFSYLGVDSNIDLLQETKAIIQRTKANAAVIKSDVITDFFFQDPPKAFKSASYTSIVMFGVLHHIPGKETRRVLLEEVTKLLSPQGTLCISFWQFAEFERFEKKYLDPTNFGIAPSELEEHDYLLGWGNDTTHARYAHSFTDAEITELLEDTNLEALDSYQADGKEHKVNRYLVLRKIQQ